MLTLQYVFEVKNFKGFDEDVIKHLSIQMKEKGIKFITGSFPKDIVFKNKKFNVYFEKKKLKNLI